MFWWSSKWLNEYDIIKILTAHTLHKLKRTNKDHTCINTKNTKQSRKKQNRNYPVPIIKNSDQNRPNSRNKQLNDEHRSTEESKAFKLNYNCMHQLNHSITITNPRKTPFWINKQNTKLLIRNTWYIFFSQIWISTFCVNHYFNK